jgi:hypothetical protein
MECDVKYSRKNDPKDNAWIVSCGICDLRDGSRVAAVFHEAMTRVPMP